MNYRKENVFVSIAVPGAQIPSPDLSRAINSYYRLKQSYISLPDDKKSKFEGESFTCLKCIFTTKIRYIERLAHKENIRLNIIEDIS